MANTLRLEQQEKHTCISCCWPPSSYLKLTDSWWNLLVIKSSCPWRQSSSRLFTCVNYYFAQQFSQFSCSVVSDSATPWTAARPTSLLVTISWNLLKFMSLQSVTPSNHLPPLPPPSPPAFNLSQHQGFFKWVSSSHQVAKVLEFQLQHQSFIWIFRTDFL